VSAGPFEMLGDPDAAACEGDVCAVPASPRPESANPPVDDSADAGSGLRVPVQR
jgi:hypothetical protein